MKKNRKEYFQQKLLMFNLIPQQFKNLYNLTNLTLIL